MRMLERNHAADDRLLPNRQPNPVSELQRKRRFFVGKSKFLRLGPYRSNLRRRAARLH